MSIADLRIAIDCSDKDLRSILEKGLIVELQKSQNWRNDLYGGKYRVKKGSRFFCSR